jgi:hypothetical protein
MAALLVYSPNCQFSQEIIQFLQSNPSLQTLVQFHNVSTHGIPAQYKSKINRVPTLLTKNGKILVGKEVKAWLESLIPCDIMSCPVGSGSCYMSSLENPDGDDSFFSLDNYGQSLQPVMTPELQEKIKKDVGQAFNAQKT